MAACPRVSAPQSPSELIAENGQLKQRVRQLEEDRERDRQSLAALHAECEAYRRSLHAWAWEQVTEEEVERWAREEPEGVSFAQLLARLERQKGQ